MLQVHATVVALGETGLLLRGPPGSGKSDLALRLIDGGAVLVADDRVDLAAVDGALVAQAPKPLAGLLEVRGVGILARPYRPAAAVGLLVDLVLPNEVPRLPERRTETVLGVAVRRLALDPFQASAPAKLRAIFSGIEATDRRFAGLAKI